MDVYVSGGVNSDPNRFEHEMSFKGQRQVTLASKMASSMREGYSVTVFSNAVDMIQNEPFDNTLVASLQSRNHWKQAMRNFFGNL